MKTKLHYVFATTIFLIAFSAFSQDNFFVEIQQQRKTNTLKNTSKAGFTYEFNYKTLSAALQKAPKNVASKTSQVTISFPNIQGELEKYNIVEASVMHADLQAKYPEIRSYIGYGVDTPTAYLRFSLSPYIGLTGIILGKENTEIFEPVADNKTQFRVNYKSNLEKTKGFNCKTLDDLSRTTNKTNGLKDADDSIHRLYTLALSVTAEYANFHGGTLAGVNAALAATLTNVNAVFENDFNVSLELAANNDNVIYFNTATDPYSGFNNYASELQNTLDTQIGDANYDVGHLLSAIGFDGNAGCIGCVCTSGLKGSGYTSDDEPVGFNFDIDLVAHEIGHQFGANHTWTHDGNEGSNVQMEPGSGSTIMGYAGIAASANIQLNSDPYFHAISIEQVTNFIKTTSCANETNTGNTTPTANAGPDLILPIGTAFKLVGTGNDTDGDVITFCWEQIDENNALTTYPNPNSGNDDAVLFRSFTPTANNTRYFPNLSDLRFGVNANQWEKVPNVGRTADFRLTVRDNKPGGANNAHDDMRVTFNPSFGPFQITSQNTTGISWSSGSTETITWDVNNTNTLPGASNVNILLSTDGGETYTEIVSNIPNNGSYALTVPNLPSPDCRLMIAPTNNNFFAINAEDFAIDFEVNSTCTQYNSANNLGINITDNSGMFSQSDIINIPDASTVTDINVGVNITHSYIGDLGIALVSPNNTEVFLKTLSDCEDEENIIGVFDDDAVAFNCFNASDNIAQRPLNDLLETFNGENASGNWTIRLGDFQPGDSGTLNSWFIEICETTLAPLDISEFTFEKVKIFPNPNDGEFTIKVDSMHAKKDISIEVFDVRGRRVYEQDFKETSRLNETVNLRHITAGMYMLYLRDKTRTYVRRIIVN
jgi:subtilisin-like proprotein convertase family protein